MKKAILGAINQAVSGKGMYIGILAAAVILLLSSVQDVLEAFRSEELLQNGFHHTFLMNALTSDAMTLALHIIAALPCTSSFIDDIKSSREKSRQHCFGWTCSIPRRAAGVCGCRACFLPHGSSVGTWRGFPALF